MNQNEEWISIPDFKVKNNLRSSDYVYELIRGKKIPKKKKGKKLFNTAGKLIMIKIPAKFVEGVHFIKKDNGIIRIHHSVTVENGVVAGGKKERT